MAPRLQQFQTKAAQVSEFLTKNGTSYYKELIEKNKTYIKDPSSNIEACQLLAKQLFYTRLASIQRRGAQISEFLTKNGPSYYKELMEKNKTYIKDPSDIETCQLLAKQLFYTRLASIPQRHEAFWKELESLKEFLKTREAWKIENVSMAALIGVECYAWFFGGEIIGRGFTVIGYHV